MQPFIYPTLHREYRTATGWLLFIYLLAPPLIVVFLVTPFFLLQKSESLGIGIAFLVLMWGLAAFFLFAMLEARKARFIVTAQSLTSESLLGRKVIPIANLKGYRADWQYTYFLSNNPADPKIKIGYTTEDYANMQQWFADRFPELDQLEQEREAAQVLIAPELGPTEEDRLTAVAQARQVARLLNGAGVVAAIWLLLHPQPYSWAVGTCLAIPLLTAVMLWQHQGTLRLDERSRGTYPTVLLALLLPLLALAWRAAFGNFELERYATFWLWAGAIGMGFVLLLLGGRYAGRYRPPHQPEFWLVVVICAFLFGSAGTTMANQAFDELSAEVYTVRVLGKETSSGSTTTYYLKLGSWGPRTTPDIVTVSAACFEHKQPGASVHIYLHPGWLRLSWFEVKD